MSFLKKADELAGQRKGGKGLKLDKELKTLERAGKKELVQEILTALNDVETYSHSVISDALLDENISVSQSAIRTWRIKNNVLQEQ